jgi:hypothetical protein
MRLDAVSQTVMAPETVIATMAVETVTAVKAVMSV